ncbi:putative membrane protein YdgH [Botrimarina colliarenosi]|uniref:Putative membrane protein YdgH n=1 Tax=Botrimarina colliarenosi TaxID=2528001 RepID=A0A5C6A9F8_9BACT|nr:MMPL family transporter [Botrimarina colliarenosi]TWT96040.1 putative membrane protein YdgH [Botrimarina colliarenosi]
MLAKRFASLINRHWLWLLVGWIVLAVGLKMIAPTWEDIAKDGDLEYLPASVPSLRGERLLQEAFPNEKAHSQVSVVLSRGGDPLTPDDRRFGLKIAEAIRTDKRLPLVDVWDETTQVVGDMLQAKDGKATMVVARLTSGLMDVANVALLRRMEQLTADFRSEQPEGLRVDLTGSAMIGGDMRASIAESLASTEATTVLLVLGCLVVIYRAPVLVLIPLATIAVSMSVATNAVALLAQHFGPEAYEWSDFKIFTTTKIFVVVILFGAGTDYCLFLIARYKEELSRGVPRGEAAGLALANVADALLGSALTTILGLATMVFAQYGKFVSSGPIVAVCLFIALLACVTFAPALLRALGPLVFWPFGSRLIEAELNADGQPTDAPLWGWIADAVMKRPATILAVTVWLSAPLVYYGAGVGVTHDFMADLAPDRVSVVGAETVGRYYGKGTIAPMKVVAKLGDSVAADDGEPLDLRTPDGRFALAPLHSMLHDLAPVADVRSLYLPTGGDPRNRSFIGSSAFRDLAAAGSPITADTFVSHTAPYKGRVTQLAVVLAENPFSKTARDQIPSIQEALAEFAKQPTLDGAPNPWLGATFELVGTTPGMRDLEVVTNSDRIRIQVLTVTAVYLVLVLLLRRPLACAFLIATVLVSYWVTLGATSLFFEWLYGDTFRGIDWKVPVFLFVILIAVGQDYNIYLVTRVFEEQRTLGLRKGLRRAIVQTGGIITSCGVIMAGTFIAMATGTLRGMVELGFALAFGVLLDTFFVRTVVVPCYFALLARREPVDTPPAETIEASSPSPRRITAGAGVS